MNFQTRISRVHHPLPDLIIIIGDTLDFGLAQGLLIFITTNVYLFRAIERFINL